MQKIYKKLFTMVELILVIAIIAFLTVTATVVLSQWLSKSRDSRRMADIAQIEKGIETTYFEGNEYPLPDSYATIQLSGAGTVVSYQGIVGETVAEKSSLKNTPKDPTDGTGYIYIVNDKQNKFQIMGMMENTESKLGYSNESVIAVDYTKRNPQTRGNTVGIFLISGTNQPINETTGTIDLNGLNTDVNMYSSNTNIINGTGLQLYGIMQTMKQGGFDYNAPKSCPSGFIPVPGNPEFNQPGFCVAKYEMSYDGIASPDSFQGSIGWNTINYTGHSGSVAVSKAGNYPIADIAQIEAISECKELGEGYHLITNNEWMTVARNIEAVPTNWSSGTVGNGYISNGVSNSNLGCLGVTNAIYSGLSRTRAAKTGPGVGSGYCDSRRQLKLSNGEIIQDLAGNVWEHINGVNTIDGSRYNTMKGNGCNGNVFGWYSYTYNSTTDTSPQCNWINGYSYEKYGPKINGFNTSNGIGRIASYSGGYISGDRILLRGGHAADAGSAGTFSIDFSRDAMNAGGSVGFRCAYIMN